MGLTKYAIGELIELVEETNAENKYGPDDVRGMTIAKEIIPTKADVANTDLSRFWVVHPKEFIYNPRTHGKHIGFGYNDTQETFIISWNNIAFRVRDCMKSTVIPEYLFMHFNREEWDREACYRSWGSSTEVFSWDALCEMILELPSLEIQQKYAGIYHSLMKNQHIYEQGLDDLKLVCDGYIEDLRNKITCEKIGTYLMQKNDRNTDKLNEFVVGLSTKKEFREAQSRVNRDELGNYKIVRPNEIAYVPTTDTWKVLAFAQNTFGHDVVVSPIYEVFNVNQRFILPSYLAMWLSRKEFDRFARFHSWGSARENFSFDSMCEVQIPIPDIKIQKAITDAYSVYIKRRKINERLKSQIKDICPILIKGSLEEGKAS